VAELAEILTEKCEARELLEVKHQTQNHIVEVNEKMEKKSNIKDVCALLDMKSNIDDVNKALTEMHEDVGGKLFKEEFASAMLEQQAVNEILSAENCVARWLWKTG
jgi:hypothetical protein